jgi:FMN reductase
MMQVSAQAPLVVGIGGTTQPGSSTERALAIAMQAVEQAGLRVRMFDGATLARLPLYVPGMAERSPEEHDLVASVREAAGVIVASPGYHGGVSGLVKNAIDLLEETARDDRPYLSDLPVGLIATAYGWQATGTTIAALRSIVHALRGWPTPFAAAVNSAACRFDAEGGCTDESMAAQLALVGQQVARAVLDRAAVGVAA